MMRLLGKLKFWDKSVLLGGLERSQVIDLSDSSSVRDIFQTKPFIPIKGGVHKAKHSEYNPNTVRKGGRVVKAMPKQLKKIKEAQELVEDEDVRQLPD